MVFGYEVIPPLHFVSPFLFRLLPLPRRLFVCILTLSPIYLHTCTRAITDGLVFVYLSPSPLFLKKKFLVSSMGGGITTKRFTC